MHWVCDYCSVKSPKYCDGDKYPRWWIKTAYDPEDREGRWVLGFQRSAQNNGDTRFCSVEHHKAWQKEHGVTEKTNYGDTRKYPARLPSEPSGQETNFSYYTALAVIIGVSILCSIFGLVIIFNLW